MAIESMGGGVQFVTVIFQQLWSYEKAHRALAAQGIPRAPSGNPFAADAPWKREDLHRVGQDDCEKLGGIFYFRILWFNVGGHADTLHSHFMCLLCEHPPYGQYAQCRRRAYSISWWRAPSANICVHQPAMKWCKHLRAVSSDTT